MRKLILFLATGFYSGYAPVAPGTAGSVVGLLLAWDVTVPLEPDEQVPELGPEQMEKYLAEMEERMREAARKFDFKQAAAYRDRVRELRNRTVTSVET